MAFPTRLNGQTITASWFQGLQDIIDKNIIWNPTTVTDAAYTLADVFNLVEANSSTNAVVITFPTCAGNGGKTYAIKGVELTNGITIDGDGTDTIDGETDALAIENLNQIFVFTCDEVNNNWIITGTAFDSTGGGGGAGDPSIYGLVTPTDYNLATWDVTNLVTAVMSINTTLPLFDDSDYQIANAVGASGYVNGPSIETDPGNREKVNSMEWTYTYPGTDDAIRLDFYNVTDGAIIGSELVKSTTTPTRIIPEGYLADTALNVRTVITVLTAEAFTLNLSRGIFSDKPANQVNLISQNDAWTYIFNVPTSATFQSDGGGGLFVGGFAINGDVSESFDTTSIGSGYRFIAKKKVSYNMSFGLLATGAVVPKVVVNGATEASSSSGAAVSGQWVHATKSGVLEKDDYIELNISTGSVSADYVQFYLNATAESSAVVHSDTGTENTFSARVDASTSPSLFSQSSNFIDSITWNSGNSEFDIVWVTDFFTVIPSVNGTCGKTSFQRLNANIIPTLIGCTVKIYDFDGTVYSDADFSIMAQSQGADYKNPNAYAVTPLTETCYIKDIKSNGTGGGASVAGAWAPRIINTASGDTSWCILGNGTAGTDGTATEFTLLPGKHIFRSRTPAYSVNSFTSKLVEDPSGAPSDHTYGSNSISSGGGATVDSVIETIIDITAPTTFQIQIRPAASSATGLGAAVSAGIVETYTTVEITKLLWR